nr:acetylcholinesterase-like [Dermacentor andersoni]
MDKMGGTVTAAVVLLLITGSCCFASVVIKDTRLGQIKGNRLNVLGRAVEEYRGIPYAQPPLGRLRFRPPVPAEPWEGTLDGRSRRTACPQVFFLPQAFANIEHTEDCLHLNVWSPQERGTDEAVPVLAWIHGGGFVQGSATQKIYDGAVLAARTGLVIVTLNYRLGFLGFLDTQSPDAPGNVGLLDQNMALKWIRDNIALFGGDPSRVTIFGESAGGMSAHAHVISPMSSGLFIRACLMSGTLHRHGFYQTVNESISKGNAVAAAVGCSYHGRNLTTNREAVVECLRSKSAFELARVSSDIFKPKIFPFLPTYPNQFLPVEPSTAVDQGLFNAADLMVGVTADEGALALMLPMRNDILPNSVHGLVGKQFQGSLREGVYAWLKTNFSRPLDVYTADTHDKRSLRRAYVDYLSDSIFVCPMHITAEGHSNKEQSVYSYVFGHLSKKKALPAWMGTPHGSDVSYVFGIPLADKERFSAEDAEVSQVMMTAWSTFASTGVPQLPGEYPWPKYTADNPVSVYISADNVTDISGFHMEKCNVWKSYWKM